MISEAQGKLGETINKIRHCHNICLETHIYCLNKGGPLADPALGRLLLDCADICDTTGRFMLRRSSYYPDLCAIAVEVCRRCAETCLRSSDDEQLRLCANVCREAEALCGELLSLET